MHGLFAGCLCLPVGYVWAAPQELALPSETVDYLHRSARGLGQPPRHLEVWLVPGRRALETNSSRCF